MASRLQALVGALDPEDAGDVEARAAAADAWLLIAQARALASSSATTSVAPSSEGFAKVGEALGFACDWLGDVPGVTDETGSPGLAVSPSIERRLLLSFGRWNLESARHGGGLDARDATVELGTDGVAHVRMAVETAKRLLVSDPFDREAGILYAQSARPLIIHGDGEGTAFAPLAADVESALGRIWDAFPSSAAPLPEGMPTIDRAVGRGSWYALAAEYARAITQLAELRANARDHQAALAGCDRWDGLCHELDTRRIQLRGMDAYDPRRFAALVCERLVQHAFADDGGDGRSAEWFAAAGMRVERWRAAYRVATHDRSALSLALNNYAWWRLVSPDVTLRDAAQALPTSIEAVRLQRAAAEERASGDAETAAAATRRQRRRLGNYLDTLALARAQNGDLRGAIVDAGEAVRIADETGMSARERAEFAERLQSYRQSMEEAAQQWQGVK